MQHVTSADQPDSLQAALSRAAIELPDERVAALDRYCRLLWEWNSRLNLTRHTDYERFVARDVVDSLAFSAELAAGEDVLDVGTGGGVPGVVLAIVRPDISVSLCESIAKKAKAVGEIVRDLGIQVPVHHARAEDLLDEHTFDTLVVRAVAPLAKLLTWFDPHWGAFRRLLVMKGPRWVEERGEAREKGLLKRLDLRKRSTYIIPGTQGESVLLEIRPREGR